ncbi:MAG: S-layer homology domain-containing protein [Oscillospiraceae bacterium]
MKKVKRFLLCALCFAVMLSSLPVLAAEADGYKHYSDVPNGEWYAEAINFMAEGGLLTGYPDGTFHPEDNIKVGELAAILCRVYGLDASNSTTGQWATNYINALSGQKLGFTSCNTARAEENVLRGETIESMVLVAKAVNMPFGSKWSWNDIGDSAVCLLDKSVQSTMVSGHEWTPQSILDAYNYGIIQGMDAETHSCQPIRQLTRAEVCQIFYNMGISKAGQAASGNGTGNGGETSTPPAGTDSSYKYFIDVPNDYPYADAINTLYENGILDSYILYAVGDSKYLKPDSLLTEYDLACMMLRLCSYDTPENITSTAYSSDQFGCATAYFADRRGIIAGGAFLSYSTENNALIPTHQFNALYSIYMTLKTDRAGSLARLRGVTKDMSWTAENIAVSDPDAAYSKAFTYQTWIDAAVTCLQYGYANFLRGAEGKFYCDDTITLGEFCQMLSNANLLTPIDSNFLDNISGIRG